MAHAILAPSAAKRWMNCAGSVLYQKSERKSSRYADEGTAAHFLAARCLQKGDNPYVYFGAQISVSVRGDAAWYSIDPHLLFKGHLFVVDQEMVAAVGLYVKWVRDALAASENGVLLVEQEVPLFEITGEEDGTGTADAVILADDGISVFDLKYGKGVVVKAEENPQLMMYALGAVDKFDPDLSLSTDYPVHLAICQPRVADAPDVWDTSIAALDNFRGEVILASSECWAAIKVGHGPLFAGEDQCRWCPGKADCPELQATVEKAIGTTIDEFRDINAYEGHNGTTPEALAEKYAALDLIEIWIKGVRARVSEELSYGNAVPGYKLVAGRPGNRAWTDEQAAEEMLRSRFKLKADEAYTRKLISPTAVEKIFGPKGSRPSKVRWERVQQFVSRADGSPMVVPESDKRPAITSVEGFTDLDDGSDLM